MSRGRPTTVPPVAKLDYILDFDTITYTFKNGRMVMSEVKDDPKDPHVILEKYAKKIDKLKEPVYINGRKKRITKADKLELGKLQSKYDELHYKLWPEDKPKRQYKKRK
jgi:hypothetical protein